MRSPALPPSSGPWPNGDRPVPELRLSRGFTAKHGFTLIELLIVVAIIAILAAIAVPNFLEAQARSKVTRAKADMRSLATAIETYASDCNHYPMGAIDKGDGKPYYDWGWGFTPDALSTPIAYMSSLPLDPYEFYYQTPNGGGTSMWPPGHLHTRFRYCRKERFAGCILDAPGWDAYYKAALGPWAIFNTPYLLISPGPDKKEDVIPQYNVHPYDPSNGTVSIGDIVYYGSIGFPH